MANIQNLIKRKQVKRRVFIFIPEIGFSISLNPGATRHKEEEEEEEGEENEEKKSTRMKKKEVEEVEEAEEDEKQDEDEEVAKLSDESDRVRKNERTFLRDEKKFFFYWYSFLTGDKWNFGRKKN